MQLLNNNNNHNYKLAQKEYKTRHYWAGKVEIVQEIEILTIRTNGKFTTHNPSWRMRRAKFSGILRYKQIP